jgi:tetratricopeptide (TPR) repeat protein
MAKIYAIKAIKLNQDNAKYWGRLGSILQLQGKNQEAKKVYDKVMELNPIYGSRFISNIEELNEEKDIEMNNILSTTLSTLLNDNIMTKLNEPEFLRRIETFKVNPLLALQDKDMMGLVENIMSKLV